MKHYKLESELAAKIVDLGIAEGWSPGFKITESKLAKMFGVSRTPIRSALKILEAEAIVELVPNKGFVTLVGMSAELKANLPVADAKDEIKLQLIADRAKGRIEQDVSENYLTSRYNTSRGVVRRILIELSAEGIVRRLPGHGWAFSEALDSPEIVAQSYSFRLAVEIAALNEQNYSIDQVQLKDLKQAHLKLQNQSADEIRSSGWFDVNTRFHETLAEWSGNAFIVEAVKSQNGLRRLKEASVLVTLPDDRIYASIAEHLSILAAIEEDDKELAALLLKKHLQNSLSFALESFRT